MSFRIWTVDNLHHLAVDDYFMFNPLLSWDLDILDPTLKEDRDEGEPRLQKVRAFLRAAKLDVDPAARAGSSASSSASESSASSESSVATLVCAPASKPAHDATFKVDAVWKPEVCLVAPRAKTFAGDLADKLPEKYRVQCVPVKNKDEVALLTWPADKLAAPRIMVKYPRRRLEGATHDAHMQIKRTGKDTAELVVFNTKGARTQCAVQVPAALLNSLFRQPALEPHIAIATPSLPGDLPTEMAGHIADFWQREMRCHVIATTCAPPDQTRPLAFDSIKAVRDGKTPGKATVRAKLHPSSIKCACGMHGLAPMKERFPSERFVGSEVEFTLSMCGRELPRLNDGRYGPCRVCDAGTQTTELLEGLCCAQTTASIGCTHNKRAGGRLSGLWVPNMWMSDSALLQVQVLIANAMRCATRLEPMLGKRTDDEIVAVGQHEVQRMSDQLDELTRIRATDEATTRSDHEMLTLDMMAVDALRSQNVRRHVRPSTKTETLAREKLEGGTSILSGNEASLAETHIGLFPPPPKRVRHG